MKDAITPRRARYLQRADECRDAAECMSNEIARATLLHVATDYDRMARSVERIDESLRWLGSKKSN